MAEIRIYVLQSPRILMDDHLITLPYKKAEACCIIWLLRRR